MTFQEKQTLRHYPSKVPGFQKQKDSFGHSDKKQNKQ